MATHDAAELARFQQFIARHLERGDTFSPEEALDLWRAENPHPNDVADTVEALSEMEAGDVGVPLAEFDRAFRRRHDLS